MPAPTDSPASLSRRVVTAGLAWSAPVVAAPAATPALAASAPAALAVTATTPIAVLPAAVDSASSFLLTVSSGPLSTFPADGWIVLQQAGTSALLQGPPLPAGRSASLDIPFSTGSIASGTSDSVFVGVATLEGRELATTTFGLSFTAPTRSTPFYRGVLDFAGPIAVVWNAPNGVVLSSPDSHTLSDASAGDLFGFILGTVPADPATVRAVHGLVSDFALEDSTGTVVGRGLGGPRSDRRTYYISLSRRPIGAVRLRYTVAFTSPSDTAGLEQPSYPVYERAYDADYVSGVAVGGSDNGRLDLPVG